MKKRNLWIFTILFLFIIVSIFYSLYSNFFREESYSLNVMDFKNMDGRLEPITYEEEVIELLKKEGYTKKIIDSNKISIHLSLTKNDVEFIKSMDFFEKYKLTIDKIPKEDPTSLMIPL